MSKCTDNQKLKDLTGKMRRLLEFKIFNMLGLLTTVFVFSFLLGGCGNSQNQPDLQQPDMPQADMQQPAFDNGTTPEQNRNRNKNRRMDQGQYAPNQGDMDMNNMGTENPTTNNRKNKKSVDIDVNDDVPNSLISYDVTTIGRSNPFMPYNEMIEYEKARSSAIAEANAKNARIREIKRLQDYAVREQDDISPYKFNLPVPPTSLDTHTVAAKITKTKVVGIMYNTKSPSAIINVDNKDYLVRPGDKIIGQEYRVVKITPNWVTAAMGSNVYSAAIGEAFSKDKMNTNQTDIYNLKERFGGRKI